jgi:acyl carrier protein
MKQEEVLALVIKNVKATVPSLAETKIDLDVPYRQLDINSLDIAEIVSKTVRELKVQVPRTELAKLTTARQLVEIICKSAG